jgi:branched-subunit amino acid aminotransferase/4-amino-4-deoxychorismate lyase
LGDHFRRLEGSASLSGKIVSLDESAVRSALRAAIQEFRSELPIPPGDPAENSFPDLRLRMTLSLETNEPELYIAVEMLPAPPEEAYRNGVKVITTGMKRLLPEAKLTRFIERSKHLRLSLSEQVNEAVMVDENGFLKEGLTSNFFGVSDGGIWTAGEGVLAGVTRSMVIEIIQRKEIPLSLEPIHLNQLSALEEAFITSSSRGVMPVCQIDRQAVGNGEPGPVTHSLIQAFKLAILEQAEPI